MKQNKKLSGDKAGRCLPHTASLDPNGIKKIIEMANKLKYGEFQIRPSELVYDNVDCEYYTFEEFVINIAEKVCKDNSLKGIRWKH